MDLTWDPVCSICSVRKGDHFGAVAMCFMGRPAPVFVDSGTSRTFQGLIYDPKALMPAAPPPNPPNPPWTPMNPPPLPPSSYSSWADIEMMLGSRVPPAPKASAANTTRCDTCRNPNTFGAAGNQPNGAFRCGQCRALRQVFG